MVSKKWETVLLLASGVIVAYTLRVNISVTAQHMREELNWSETDKGLVLSAFYWGYALGQVPASMLVNIYGGKVLFGLSVLIPSVLTLAVPHACRLSLMHALLIRFLIGLFESASFPSLYHFFPIWIPADEKTFLIPVVYSGLYIGVILGFSLSGVLVASSHISVAGYSFGGWPAAFYFFGILGIIWFPVYMWLMHESPATHPFIGADEAAYLKRSTYHHECRSDPTKLLRHSGSKDFMLAEVNTGRSGDINSNSSSDSPVLDELDMTDIDTQRLQDGVTSWRYCSLCSNTSGGGSSVTDWFCVGPVRVDGGTPPWDKFLSHPVAITLLINNWTQGWINFLLLSEMPAYLEDVLGFSLEFSSILSIPPYIVLFMSSLFFGRFFEYCQRHHGMKTNSVRQYGEFIAFMGGSCGLLAIGHMSDKYIAYLCMLVTQLLLGAVQVGLPCSYSDVAPNFSSAFNSLGNAIGAVAGIAGPLAVGYLTSRWPENHGIWGWRAVFVMTALMSAISLYMWSLYQTSDIVDELNSPRQSRKRKI
jgi:MFS family permease